MKWVRFTATALFAVWVGWFTYFLKINPLVDLPDGGQTEIYYDRQLYFGVATQLLFAPLALGYGLAELVNFMQRRSSRAALTGDTA